MKLVLLFMKLSNIYSTIQKNTLEIYLKYKLDIKLNIIEFISNHK
jgi:hypothetical protein